MPGRHQLLAFVGIACLVESSLALSRSVVLPLTAPFSAQTARDLTRSFQRMVDSTDFFVRETANSCSVPLFGDDVRVAFGARHDTGRSSSLPSAPTQYELTVTGAISRSDFGWICAKFFDSTFEGVDMEKVRVIVENHFNAQPPDPGYDAALSAGDGTIEAMLSAELMQELKEQGFVVVDTAPKTMPAANKRLSDFWVDKTDQGRKVRRDTVAFLNEEEAASCGLKDQFDLLMSIAAYLNENLELKASVHQPIKPGTAQKPLTNPRCIQAAEYGMGDFYVAHSDNSLTESSNVRHNYRHFTCILYCNDDWDEEKDRGALRIYSDSSNIKQPSDAKKTCRHTDIYPLNGRLLIFDSTLVHSVERVTRDLRTRRALTLWILRPEDSGARGEQWYVPKKR